MTSSDSTRHWFSNSSYTDSGGGGRTKCYRDSNGDRGEISGGGFGARADWGVTKLKLIFFK